MKKLIIYTFAACAFGSLFTACTPEEENLFSQSSAERLNATVPKYTELLCDAPNGWVMEYFVNNDWESGYTYLMKFNKNTSVTIAGDNVWIGGKYKESTSMFEVITDDGPVLTFNTFNPIFHLFATPDNVVGNGAPTDPNNPEKDLDESGYGHRGDYEFVIEKGTKELITLRGKKWGQTILLKRLADDVDWEEYLAFMKEKKSEMFPANMPDMRMVAGDDVYVVTNMASGVASFYPEDGDALTETTKVPYIVTEDGFRLVKPFKGTDGKGGFAVQTFTVDEEVGAMVCTDAAQDALIYNYDASRWLLDITKRWMFDPEALGGRFADAYAAFAAGVKGRPYNGLKSLRLMYNTTGKSFMLAWATTQYPAPMGMYGTFAVGEDGTFAFGFDGTSGDRNAVSTYKNVKAVKEFIELLQSATYIVEYPNPLNATYIKFTSTTDAEDYFHVSLLDGGK